MKTTSIRAALALLIMGLVAACSSTPDRVAEYSQRSIEGYSKEAPTRESTVIIERDTEVRGRSMRVDPYYTGTTYRDRTLYGRP